MRTRRDADGTGSSDGRRVGNERTRARILAAGRDLLADPAGLPTFTVEAVARRAGVTRVTVYNQFGSKLALVEAIFDTLSIVREGIDRIVAAVQRPDPLDALDAFVAVLAELWDADRLAIRRLQGLAALDPEFAVVWRERGERRRYGLGRIVSRLDGARAVAPSAQRRVVDVLMAVVAFETLDVIAGARPLAVAVPAIQRVARAAVGLGSDPGV